ncbi:hypothetical protein RJT34_14075 [Clitoria ternatea]|uniref:BRCT domain-containing protein n=1 Tax=Clitoria ternatea TaxID=43366 RepID=A0AAN9JQ36_CLITE
MAPSGSDDREGTSIHADFDYVDTQPFDPHSPSCDGEYFEDTVPFDDDVLGTELVDLTGDTQVLDFGGETEALDFADTQLLDVEGSDSDRTEVLENVYGDDDEVCVHGPRHNNEKGESSSGRGDNNGPVIAEQNSSGSMPPRFAFLRAESLRQAALANQNMDLKQTQDKTNSVMRMGQFCQEPLAARDNRNSFPRCSEKVREVDQENEHGKNSVESEGFENKSMSKCKVANSAVRKLFYDDLPFETNGPSLSSNDFNEGDDLNKLPVYGVEFKGLSYANSQEPGELSQVNALDFVDRFLKDNIMEFDQESNCVKNMEEKSKSIPSTKGKQSLAKRVNDRDKIGRAEIYDWDDSREDEGGGEIYLRRKEDFFKGETHRPRSLPGFRKSKACRSNDEEQLSIPIKREINSDSRFGWHNLKARDNAIQGLKFKRNLANEMNEQFNNNCSRGEMESNADAGTREILDVGLDTQMAAEAMEALCNAEDIVDHVANDATHVTRSGRTYQLNNSSTGKVGLVSSKKPSGQYNRKREVDVKSKLQTSVLSKKSTEEVKQCKRGNVMTRSKRRKLNAEGNRTSSADENGRVSLSPLIEQRNSAGALKRRQLNELNNRGGDNNDKSGRGIVNKRQLQDEVWHFTPIARRTRQSLAVKHSINLGMSSKSSREGDARIDSHEKSSGVDLQASRSLDSKATTWSSDHFELDDNSKLCQLEKPASKESAVSVSNDIEMDTLNYPRRRRCLRIRQLSDHDKGSKTLVDSSKPFAQPKDIAKSTAGKRKIRTESVVKSHLNCQTHSSSCDGSVISSIEGKQEKKSEQNLDKADPGDNSNNFEVTSSDESPRERYKSSDLACRTPATCRTPVNEASPVCMGDDCDKQRSRLLKVSRKELQRELRSLSSVSPKLVTPSKDSRKRKDMTDVRILYSHHLDEDIIKHQKKILARLGVSVASSIADATHFITDQFVRTRNMLEAIASGKLVVTHLWIESCGQASCFIDERNYILRDVKKEKELGFSMPVSLARAVQHPLLEGRRVLITPKTKPSKEIIASLVKAVQGQAMERICRSVLKDRKISDDLLILSCEEDYPYCVPFLEKGAMVYSSELLLNGIVTQKLEYQRYCLFTDRVEKTRSTIWLKRNERTFIPVTKRN